MKDFEKLNEFLNIGKVKNSRKSRYTGFKNYEGVYLFSNEDLSPLKLNNVNLSNVGIVTSSADQIFHFIKEGAKQIDAFDINIFSKYVAKLKLCMIQKYSKKEYFNLLLNLNKPEVISFILLDVCKNLDKDDLSFWGIYYKSLILNKNNYSYDLLFGNQRFIDDISKLSYYDERSFNKVKKNAIDVNINYIDSSLEKLKPNKKYDVLYISNLIQRIYEYYTLSGLLIDDRKDDMIKKIIDSSFSVISDDGILFDYYLGNNYTNLDKVFGKYYGEFSQKYIIKKNKTSNGSIYSYRKI